MDPSHLEEDPSKRQIVEGPPWEFTRWLAERNEWSAKTFGTPEQRSYKGPLDHLYKELEEAKERPFDAEEWIDVLLLTFDCLFRVGIPPGQVLLALIVKQGKNRERQWPPVGSVPPDQAVGHLKPPIPYRCRCGCENPLCEKCAAFHGYSHLPCSNLP